MLEGTPGIALFLFALPLILGNLFQQFYNMVDSMIVGQFVGENALAAVGLPGGWKPAGNFRLPDEPADPAVAAYTG